MSPTTTAQPGFELSTSLLLFVLSWVKIRKDYCRIDPIKLDLTVTEKMSFNLTSFTSYLIPSLFTMDFSLIHLNGNSLLWIEVSVSPYKAQHSSCFSRPFYQGTSFVPVILQPDLLQAKWPSVDKHPLYIYSAVFQHSSSFTQVVLFIGSHGCGGCCLSPENKAWCLCQWLHQQIPSTTHFWANGAPRFWLEETTFTIRSSTEWDYLVLFSSSVPRFYSRVPSRICGLSLQV